MWSTKLGIVCLLKKEDFKNPAAQLKNVESGPGLY